MESQPPRFLDTVRSFLRARHYSLRTETAYVAWIRRFIVFHGKRHPETMGTVEVNAFLTHLAVDGHVSASTQNQALAALLFLYETVLRSPLPDIGNVIRASKPARLPVVMTREETATVLRQMDGLPWMVATMLYGSGHASAGVPPSSDQGSRFWPSHRDHSRGERRSGSEDHASGVTARAAARPSAAGASPPPGGSCRRIRIGMAPQRVGAEVSGCFDGVDLAVRLPRREPEHRSAKRDKAATSSR